MLRIDAQRRAYQHAKSAGIAFLRASVDAALMGIAATVFTLQMLIGLETIGRRLTAEEITLPQHIFKDRVDHMAVTIKEYFVGLASMTNRSFVVGNAIYMHHSCHSCAVLVHEIAHFKRELRGFSPVCFPFWL